MAESKKDAQKKEKTPTAIKRDKQNEEKRLLNKSFRSKVHTATRSFEQAVQQKASEDSQKKLNCLYSLLDKGVKKGIYKINKVSRLKSKLSQKVKI